MFTSVNVGKTSHPVWWEDGHHEKRNHTDYAKHENNVAGITSRGQRDGPAWPT